MKLQHLVEEEARLLIVFTVLVISVSLFIEAVPLFFTKAIAQPAPSVKPYNALQVAGRDIYVREGCYNCHSQMIRPFRTEAEHYGHYSVVGESVYDRPFRWGSKHTDPDLVRVGGCYPGEWHRIHLLNPRDIVPESSMPAFPWLARNKVDAEATVRHMKALHSVGTPYSDEEIEKAPEALENKSELDAVIAYLQGPGSVLENVR